MRIINLHTSLECRCCVQSDGLHSDYKDVTRRLAYSNKYKGIPKYCPLGRALGILKETLGTSAGRDKSSISIINFLVGSPTLCRETDGASAIGHGGNLVHLALQ